jgi:hypothetical protein
MMRNWLTTHFPHPYPDSLPWHIYLQRNHKRAMDGVAKGDRVFFYEYKYQKPVNDGKEYPVGRVGIVRVAYVSGDIYERNKLDAIAKYSDGRVGDWTWAVPTGSENENGFVHRQDVLKILNYSPNSYLRGFNGGTGVKQLTEVQAQELLRLFKRGK